MPTDALPQFNVRAAAAHRRPHDPRLAARQIRRGAGPEAPEIFIYDVVLLTSWPRMAPVPAARFTISDHGVETPINAS